MRNVRMASVRPLVRYVDRDQAVVETHLRYSDPLEAGDPHPLPDDVEVLIEVRNANGFVDEHRTRAPIKNHASVVRFDLVHPHRWWPAGMGEQALYDFNVHVYVEGRCIDTRSTTIGLASVRPADVNDRHVLMVNGQAYAFQSIMAIDRIDERKLLPLGGNSLVIVRDHYGPDVLYNAADRAGILIVQCVPIHPDATPEADVVAQVDRLSAHPCLAGWFVGHQGGLTDQVAQRLSSLDPAHVVFRGIEAIEQLVGEGEAPSAA